MRSDQDSWTCILVVGACIVIVAAITGVAIALEMTK